MSTPTKEEMRAEYIQCLYKMNDMKSRDSYVLSEFEKLLQRARTLRLMLKHGISIA